jgi:hypothetical protein
MKDDVDLALKRLLRSAAGSEVAPAEAPFGFDTRVVALWRAGGPGPANGIGRLLRHVAMIATAVIVISAAAAYREVSRTNERNEPFANEFAIADFEIQDEFSP